MHLQGDLVVDVTYEGGVLAFLTGDLHLLIDLIHWPFVVYHVLRAEDKIHVAFFLLVIDQVEHEGEIHHDLLLLIFV